MAKKKKNEVAATTQESVGREEVAAFLGDIATKIVESDRSFIHSAIALNQILRVPNAHEIFDEDLKQQARDLWLKIKSTGLQLTDPPLIFGTPDLSSNSELQSADGEPEDNSEAIVIELRPRKEDEDKNKKNSRQAADDDDYVDDDFDDDDDDSDEEENTI